MRKLLVIINPCANMGRGEKRGRWLLSSLQRAGLEFDAFFTTAPGDAERVAAQHAGFPDTIVAVGGDGTVYEVINGIMQRKERPVLAILPAGRANDIAVHIGLGRGRNKAWRALREGDVSNVDLIRFNDRYAGNVVSVGYDALIQRKAEDFGRLYLMRYAVEALLLIFKGMARICLRIEYAGGVWEGPFTMALVGHTSKYARYVRICPGLRIDGGRMKIACYRPVGKPLALTALYASTFGLAGLLPHALMAETPWVEIFSKSRTLAQSDGELFDLEPGDSIRLELAKGVLRVKTLGRGSR